MYSCTAWPLTLAGEYVELQACASGSLPLPVVHLWRSCPRRWEPPKEACHWQSLQFLGLGKLYRWTECFRYTVAFLRSEFRRELQCKSPLKGFSKMIARLFSLRLSLDRVRGSIIFLGSLKSRSYEHAKGRAKGVGFTLPCASSILYYEYRTSPL